MRSALRGLLHAGFAILLLLAASAASCLSAHPLDPLSASEINTTTAILRAADAVDPGTRYSLIDLDEPAKQEVLVWKPGQPVIRKAFVIARRGRTVYRGRRQSGRAPRRALGDGATCRKRHSQRRNRERPPDNQADSRWRAAMRKRGFDRLDQVFCAPLSAGYRADPSEAERRLVRVVCFAGPVTDINVWARPIEGLVAVVDLDAGEVVRLVDKGSPPVAGKPPQIAEPPVPTKQSASQRPPATSRCGKISPSPVTRWVEKLVVSLSHGPARRAHCVFSPLYRWGPRAQRALSRLCGRDVRALYGPDEGWSFRTFMDVGESASACCRHRWPQVSTARQTQHFSMRSCPTIMAGQWSANR